MSPNFDSSLQGNKPCVNIQTRSKTKIQQTINENKNISPPRKKQKDNTSNDDEECFLSLEEVKKIKTSERTKAQQKRYKHLLHIQSMARETPEEREARNLRDRIGKKELRSKETPEKHAERNLQNRIRNQQVLL